MLHRHHYNLGYQVYVVYGLAEALRRIPQISLNDRSLFVGLIHDQQVAEN